MYWKNEALAPLSEGNQFLSEGIPSKQVRHLHCSLKHYMINKFNKCFCSAFTRHNKLRNVLLFYKLHKIQLKSV